MDQPNSENWSNSATADQAAGAALSKSSSTNKVLLGCGIGCAVLLALAVGTGIGISVWISSPGEQVPTDDIIGDDTLAVAALQDPLLSQGTVEFLNNAIVELQRISREQSRGEVPESFGWLEDLSSANQAQGSAILEAYSPTEVTYVLEPIEGGFARVAAMNFRRFVRPARMALGMAGSDAASATHVVGDATFYEFEDDASDPSGSGVIVMGFYDGTFLLSNDGEALTRVARRLESRADSATVAPEREATPKVTGDWLVSAQLDGDTDEFGTVFSTFFNRPVDEVNDWLDRVGGEVSGATFGLAPRSSDSVEARITLEFADATQAANASEPFEQVLVEIAKQLEDEEEIPIEFERVLSPVGNKLVADLRWTGLEEALRESARSESNR